MRSITLLSLVAILVAFPCSVLLTSCGGGTKAPVQKKKEKEPPLSHSPKGKDDPIAATYAKKYAGMIDDSPNHWWYADTTTRTKGQKSFGLFSEQSNQKVLFLVFDDMTAPNNLKSFAAKPPYVWMKDVASHQVADSGMINLPIGKMKWILAKYQKLMGNDKEPKWFKVMLAGFPSIEDGKSVLVVAKGYDDIYNFNYKQTHFILETVQKGKPKKPEPEPEPTTVEKIEEPEEELSSQDDIDEFMKSAAATLNEDLELPDQIKKKAREYKKKKGKVKKWRSTYILVGVNRKGMVKKMEVKQTATSKDLEMVNKALTDAIQTSGTFKSAPVVKSNLFKFRVRLSGDKIVLTADEKREKARDDHSGEKKSKADGAKDSKKADGSEAGKKADSNSKDSEEKKATGSSDTKEAGDSKKKKKKKKKIDTSEWDD